MPEQYAHLIARGAERPADDYGWGQLQWLDGHAVTGCETLTLGLAEFPPGGGNPLHYHPNSDEVLLVLEGEIEHLMGDESYRLGPGDSIHIPQNLWHRAINAGTVTARCVVCFNTGHRQVVFAE